MNSTRENISRALYDQLKNNAVGTGANQFPFATFQRGLKPWGDVPQANQPAAFLVKWREAVSQNALGLSVYTLDYWLVIYLVVDPTTGVLSETTVNAILDAIDAAIDPTPPYEKQPLFGLVTNAWIEGDVMIDQGILDQQAAIFIPIKVKTGA